MKTTDFVVKFYANYVELHFSLEVENCAICLFVLYFFVFTMCAVPDHRDIYVMINKKWKYSQVGITRLGKSYIIIITLPHVFTPPPRYQGISVQNHRIVENMCMNVHG